MAYKIPITIERFIEASKTKPEKVKIAEAENKNKLKQEVDYYLGLLERYDGKTIGELANEKYADQKLDYDKRSDDDLLKEATTYADSIKSKKSNEIVAKGDKQKQDILLETEEVKEDAKENINKLENAYANQTKTSKDSALKNGIARSSIIKNLLNSQSSAYNAGVNDVRAKEKENLDRLNGEIAYLEQEIEKSLATLDMESAVTLNEKLTKLKDERNATNKKITEYNEKIDKKRADYANELAKTEDGQAIADYVTSRGGKYVVEGRRALIEYLQSLPTQKAYEELESLGNIDKYFGKGTIEMLKKYIESWKTE